MIIKKVNAYKLIENLQKREYKRDFSSYFGIPQYFLVKQHQYKFLFRKSYGDEKKLIIFTNEKKISFILEI